MKSPFAGIWSVLRGDRHMVDAYLPSADVAAEPNVSTADLQSSSAPKAADQDA